MNYLAQHIELLIAQHECIMVPHFGGFVTQTKNACVTGCDSIFTPPSKTVGFNEQLQGNDGILVYSYQKTYNLSEAEAKRLLQSDILDMRKLLLEHGEYSLGKLGILKQDEDGVIQFSASSEWTAPDFYGLDSLEISPLECDEKAEVMPNCTSYKPTVQCDMPQEHITLNIKRRTLHTALSVAAAIILFFFVATPVNKNGWYNNQAVLTQDIIASAMQIMPRMESKVPDIKPSAEIVRTNKSIQADTLDLHHAEPALQTEFAVVVASAIPEDNARNFIAHLEKKNIHGASIHKHGAMLRVLFRGFDTEEDARQKMRNLLSDSEFQGAWIIQLK